MLTPAEQAAKDAADKQVKAAEDKAAKDHVNAAVEAAKQPVIVVGRPGGAFNIEGDGFGGKGILMIGDRVVETTMWEDQIIKGQLPEGIKGTVSLRLDNGTTRFGVYPIPKALITTTTTVTHEVSQGVSPAAAAAGVTVPAK